MAFWKIGGAAAGSLAVLALLAAGCGSAESEPEPTGRSMVRSAPAPAETNEAPEIRRVAISPDSPVPGATLRAVVDAHDPEGDALRYEHRWLRNGREVASGRSPSAEFEFQKGDRIELEVVVSDGREESEVGRAWANVGNRPPTLKGVAITPSGDVRAGDLLAADPLADDPDGDRVEFQVRWRVDGEVRGEGTSFSTEGLTRGDRVVAEVVASDGSLETRPVQSGAVTLGNTPPKITALPGRRVDEGSFVYDFEAEDPDGDRNLRYWLEAGPEGMSLDPISGQLRWSPRAGQVGTHAVEVGVKDSYGDGTTFVFEVTVNAEEPAPTPAAGSGG